MNNGQGLASHSARRRTFPLDSAIASTLALATLCYFSIYTQSAPYFLDTFGYFADILKAHRGDGDPGGYRLANTYLYYFPVVHLGGLGFKVISVAAITAFAVIYYFLIKRDFSRPVAVVATILVVTAPASVITSTHLKEDFTCLAPLALSLVIIGRASHLGWIFAAGIVFGISLLLKEISLVAAPLLLSLMHYYRHRPSSLSEFFSPRAILRSLGCALILAAGVGIIGLVHPSRFSDFLVMASSPYMGQFLGPFSPLQARGVSFWHEAILYLFPVYFIFLVSAAVAIRTTNFVKALYLLQFLIMFVFLSNTTVSQMRHYAPAIMFLAPLFADGCKILLELIARKKTFARLVPAGLTFIAIIIGTLQIMYVHPTVEYRQRMSPQVSYYGKLGEQLAADSLLLGMDNCPIARFNTGAPCRTHKPDLTAEGYEVLRAEVDELLQDHRVYLIPDFFSYDANGLVRARFREDFELNVFFSSLGEDYHAMTYGRSIDDVVRRVEDTRNCIQSGPRHITPVKDTDLPLQLFEQAFRCSGQPGKLRFITYKGRQTPLDYQHVFAVSRK